MENLFARYGVTLAEVRDALGLSRTAADYWRSTAAKPNRPSAAHAREIERRFKIPKHAIRPDIWDAPPGFRLPPMPRPTKSPKEIAAAARAKAINAKARARDRAELKKLRAVIAAKAAASTPKEKPDVVSRQSRSRTGRKAGPAARSFPQALSDDQGSQAGA